VTTRKRGAHKRRCRQHSCSCARPGHFSCDQTDTSVELCLIRPLYLSVCIHSDAVRQHANRGRASAAVGSTLAPVLDLGTSDAIKTILPFRCGREPMHNMPTICIYLIYTDAVTRPYALNRYLRFLGHSHENMKHVFLLVNPVNGMTMYIFKATVLTTQAKYEWHLVLYSIPHVFNM